MTPRPSGGVGMILMLMMGRYSEQYPRSWSTISCEQEELETGVMLRGDAVGCCIGRGQLVQEG